MRQLCKVENRGMEIRLLTFQDTLVLRKGVIGNVLSLVSTVLVHERWQGGWDGTMLGSWIQSTYLICNP